MEERNELRLTEDGVIGLTNFRLNLEPRGSRLEYRTGLQAALRSYRLPPGRLLHATLTTDDPDPRHDVENVLFYNVGQGAFAAHDSVGLRLERFHRAPDGYRYRADYGPGLPTDGFRFWRRGETLADWDLLSLKNSSLGKATEVWWALGHKISFRRALDPGAWFGASVTVATRFPVKLAGVLKGLIDGVISACVDFDGPHRREISVRLARICGATPEQVSDRLTVQDAPLGRGLVIRLYRNNVMWNPPDHRCLAIEVLRGKPVGDEAFLSGCLFQIFPAQD